MKITPPPYIYYLIPIALLTGAYWNSVYHPITLTIFSGIGVLLAVSALAKVHTRHRFLKLLVAGFAGLSLLSLESSQAANLGHLEILLDLSVLTIFVGVLVSSSWHRLFLNTIMVIIGVEGIMTMIQYLTRTESRAAGTFLNPEVASEYFPNALGLFLAMTIPLLWMSSSKKLNTAQIGITVIGVTGLLLTFSRGATISFLIPTALILIGLLFFKHYQKATSICIALCLSVVSFWGLNQLRGDQQLDTNSIQEKIRFEGSERSTSVNERFEFISNGLMMMVDHSLLGFGPSTFVQVYPQYQSTLLATSSHPHNWAIKIGIERGIITMLTLIGIIFTAITLAFRGFKEKSTQEKTTLVILFGSLIAAALHNSIDFNLNFGINMLTLFLIIAAFVQQGDDGKAKKGFNLIALLMIAMLIFSFRHISPLQETHTLAHEAYESGNIPQATTLFESLEEPYLDSHPLLAELYVSQEQPEKALSTLEAYHQFNTLDASSHNYKGAILLNQGNLEEAAFAFQDALERDPKNFLSYYNGLYQTLNQLENRQKIDLDQPQVLQLLQEYLPLAEQNIHYTAQKNNIREAIFLSHLFASLPGQTEKETFDELTETFHSIAMSHIPEEQQCSLEAMLNLECELQFPD